MREKQAQLVEQMIRENEEHAQAYAENGKLKGKLALAQHSKKAANDDLTVAKKNVSSSHNLALCQMTFVFQLIKYCAMLQPMVCVFLCDERVG